MEADDDLNDQEEFEVKDEDVDEEELVDDEEHEDENRADAKSPKENRSNAKDEKKNEKSDRHERRRDRASSSREEFEPEEYDSDYNEEDDKGDKAKIPEGDFTAEDLEREFINQPPIKSVMSDIKRLKRTRRLVIHPITMEQLYSEPLSVILQNDTTEIIRLQFIRSKDNEKEWAGILLLYFNSLKASKQTISELKEKYPGITVRQEEPAEDSRVTVDNFVNDNRKRKVWSETLLTVKNLSDETTVDHLLEVFPDAEDIVLHKDPSDSRRKERWAYIIYHSKEAANDAAKKYSESDLELHGHRLMIFSYNIPTDNVPRTLLRLGERRIVLKYMDKVKAKMENNESMSTSEKESLSKVVEKCERVISHDDKARDTVKLSKPSLEAIKQMKHVDALPPKRVHGILIKLGIIERRRSRHRSPPSHNRRYSGGRSRRSSDRRPSPGRRAGNWRSSRGGGGRSGGNLMNRGNFGGMGNINPLAALMQQNAGLLGNTQSLLGQTPSLLSQEMLLQANMGFGGGALMNAQNLMQRAGGMEPPGKMLRLDETGQFRPMVSQGDSGHRSGRMDIRSDGRGFRDGQGQRRRYDDSQDRGMGSSGGGEGGSDPVNLLLNLSHMLSQKRDQPRDSSGGGNRGYGRDDYRSLQRYNEPDYF